MSVNEQVLDAIELLMNNSIQQAGYDKTIQAQIVSCQDPSIGKYKCKYQDALIYAYATNPDINFSKGTNVYILIPENNMSKDKTILGTIDKLGVDYISMAVGEQAYNIIGSNVLSNGAAAFYLDVDIADYTNDIYVDQGTDQVGLNITELNEYIKQASSILIGATIQTTIPQEQQKQGDYGIKFTLQFKDERGNIGIDREYILDVDKMIDNPYNLINPTRQYAIFDIDSQNFIRVKKITIFNKDFPSRSDADSDSPYEITLTNLEFECAARMAEEELNGLGLSIITPRGLIFTNPLDQDKILQAQVKFKGRVVPAANVSFYWGTQDLQITPQKDRYNKYLGRGWYCINNYNEIQSEEGARSIQWVSYGDTYQVSFNLAKVRDNRIKVAAVYDGNVITKQINIQNLTNSVGVITIESSNGTEFHYGIGQTLLSCSISNNISYQGTLTYAWGWQNGGKDLQQLSSTSSTATVEAKYITNFAIYKCSVYDSQGIIGTGLIKLTNSMQEGNINPLMIENGTVLYKYNEKGVSPTSRTLQNPQIIKVLKFKLYDDVGQEIEVFHGEGQNRLIDSRANVKWHIPKNNTLLVLPDPPATTPQATQYIVNNTETLTYDIAQRYDIRKTINQIILQVTYNGVTSYAQTNLTFTKQGQVGTNGTDYYVNILPNVPDGETSPLFPMITKFNDTGKCKLNYEIQQGVQSSDEITEGVPYQLLKVQFLHGGELVTLGQNDSIRWRVLKNHYYGSGNNSIDDVSDFSIPDNDNNKLIYNHSLASNSQVAANIIECQITYNGHTYYSAIPFITAYMSNSNNTFDLEEGTGFHYVMYSSEGMQPEYASLPFNFINSNRQTITGTCTIHGTIRVKDNNPNASEPWPVFPSINLKQDSQDQCKIQPVGFYNGECVNNSVRYEVAGVGIINIPIHFYLNRYNFAHLNGWDGNSIQINEKDGYILAPQMGAGKKENNNSFTGVLMGQVKNPAKSQSDVGLFGYNKGSRSFFINSQNGSALFGNGKGQIIIDPGTVDSNGNVLNAKAMLYSHDFWTDYNQQTGLPSRYDESNYADAGMLIDLTTPQIVFKNKMFYIDANGSIWAGRQKINNQYTSNYNFSVNAITGDVQMIGNLQAGKISGTNNYNFEVNNSATDNNPLIRAGYKSGSYNFIVTANGNVEIIGNINATSGTIGTTTTKSWIIGGDNNRAWIHTYQKDGIFASNNDQLVSGLYLGTDGFSVVNSSHKQAIYTDSDWNIYFGQGTSLSWNQITDKSNVTLNSDFSNSNTVAGQVAASATNAQTNSSNALSNANLAKTLIQLLANGEYGTQIDGVQYTGTFINGNSIYSPLIYANLFTAQPLTNGNNIGGFLLKGYYSGQLKDVFYIHFQGNGNSPITYLESWGTLSLPNVIQLRADSNNVHGGYIRAGTRTNLNAYATLQGYFKLDGNLDTRTDSVGGHLIVSNGIATPETYFSGTTPQEGQVYFKWSY